MLHDWTVVLMSWVILGQQTEFLAQRFILSATKCPVWSVLSAEFLIACGVTSLSFLKVKLFSTASLSQ